MLTPRNGMHGVHSWWKVSGICRERHCTGISLTYSHVFIIATYVHRCQLEIIKVDNLTEIETLVRGSV